MISCVACFERASNAPGGGVERVCRTGMNMLPVRCMMRACISYCCHGARGGGRAPLLGSDETGRSPVRFDPDPGPPALCPCLTPRERPIRRRCVSSAFNPVHAQGVRPTTTMETCLHSFRSSGSLATTAGGQPPLLGAMLTGRVMTHTASGRRTRRAFCFPRGTGRRRRVGRLLRASLVSRAVAANREQVALPPSPPSLFLNARRK